MGDVVTVFDVAARRALVATTTVDGAPGSPPAVNGIDYLEVNNVIDADPANDFAELLVRFVHPLAGAEAAPATPLALTADLVSIVGGDRVVDPDVISVDVAADTLTIRVRPIGDHSIYTLELDNAAGWLDPQLARVPFSFLVECATRFDCGGGSEPVGSAPATPHLDYLARDYHSLRQMMLDRLAVTVPGWTERNPADLGVALVELLAFVGDRIAYGQDVVATEAYLDKARFRTSVARHLRLIDYHLHEGHNARAWVALEVADEVIIGPGARFWTAVDGHPTVTPSLDVFLDAVSAGAEFFESVHTTHHRPAHNKISLHTWMGTVTVLPQGATEATLRDVHGSVDLRAGSYLLFEATADPDADDRSVDATKRQVVRLTSVEEGVDPLDRPGGVSGVRLLRVCWSPQDALEFDLPLGDAVAAARANLVLVDHGRSLREPIRLPPATARYRPSLPDRSVTTTTAAFRTASVPATAIAVEALDEGRLDGSIVAALAKIDIDLVSPTVVSNGEERWVASDHITMVLIEADDGDLMIDAAPVAARELAAPNPVGAHHEIGLYEVGDTPLTEWTTGPNHWQPKSDLVRVLEDDQCFVVEVGEGGHTTLRFGDDESGKAPNIGDEFDAVYRVGSGVVGNVGADTIRHLWAQTGTLAGTTDRQTVFGPIAAITRVRNPMVAAGGTEPESIVEAKIRAPEVFTRQLRAVTPADYVARLEAHPLVQRAVARRRWTGSWSTLFCTVDLIDGHELDAEREIILRRWIEPYRTMGHDIEIDEPLLVPIELELCVGIAETTPRRSVNAELSARLGTGIRPDGSLGLFHPNRLTFGDRIYLSTIVHECQSVPGVVEVEVRTFRRLGSQDTISIDRGFVELTGREIAVLNNDPNRPEQGSLTIDVVGGR